MDILEIKNVTYNYSNSKEKILSSVNQKFELGQFYAIIGKSGKCHREGWWAEVKGDECKRSQNERTAPPQRRI